MHYLLDPTKWPNCVFSHASAASCDALRALIPHDFRDIENHVCKIIADSINREIATTYHVGSTVYHRVSTTDLSRFDLHDMVVTYTLDLMPRYIGVEEVVFAAVASRAA